MTEDDDALIASLLAMGALEALPTSSESGEPLYRVTRACGEIFPELYRIHSEAVSEIVHSLWLLGLVEVSFSSEGSQIVYTTDEGLRRFGEVGPLLSEEQRRMVATILSFPRV